MATDDRGAGVLEDLVWWCGGNRRSRVGGGMGPQTGDGKEVRERARQAPRRRAGPQFQVEPAEVAGGWRGT